MRVCLLSALVATLLLVVAVPANAFEFSASQGALTVTATGTDSGAYVDGLEVRLTVAEATGGTSSHTYRFGRPVAPGTPEGGPESFVRFVDLGVVEPETQTPEMIWIYRPAPGGLPPGNDQLAMLVSMQFGNNAQRSLCTGIFTAGGGTPAGAIAIVAGAQHAAVLASDRGLPEAFGRPEDQGPPYGFDLLATSTSAGSGTLLYFDFWKRPELAQYMTEESAAAWHRYAQTPASDHAARAARLAYWFADERLRNRTREALDVVEQQRRRGLLVPAFYDEQLRAIAQNWHGNGDVSAMVRSAATRKRTVAGAALLWATLKRAKTAGTLTIRPALLESAGARIRIEFRSIKGRVLRRRAATLGTNAVTLRAPRKTVVAHIIIPSRTVGPSTFRAGTLTAS